MALEIQDQDLQDEPEVRAREKDPKKSWSCQLVKIAEERLPFYGLGFNCGVNLLFRASIMSIGRVRAQLPCLSARSLCQTGPRILPLMHMMLSLGCLSKERE